MDTLRNETASTIECVAGALMEQLQSRAAYNGSLETENISCVNPSTLPTPQRVRHRGERAQTRQEKRSSQELVWENSARSCVKAFLGNDMLLNPVG